MMSLYSVPDILGPSTFFADVSAQVGICFYFSQLVIINLDSVIALAVYSQYTWGFLLVYFQSGF